MVSAMVVAIVTGHGQERLLEHRSGYEYNVAIIAVAVVRCL